MKIETDNLLSVSNFAKKHEISPSHIYQLIKDNRIVPVIIDETPFIDIKKYPTLPTRTNKK